MSTLQTEVMPRAAQVSFVDGRLLVTLVDGRELSTPLSWFERLSNASDTELKDYELIGDGEGIHWPQLDEDLSVKGLLQGNH